MDYSQFNDYSKPGLSDKMIIKSIQVNSKYYGSPSPNDNYSQLGQNQLNPKLLAQQNNKKIFPTIQKQGTLENYENENDGYDGREQYNKHGINKDSEGGDHYQIGMNLQPLMISGMNITSIKQNQGNRAINQNMINIGNNNNLMMISNNINNINNNNNNNDHYILQQLNRFSNNERSEIEAYINERMGKGAVISNQRNNSAKGINQAASKNGGIPSHKTGHRNNMNKQIPNLAQAIEYSSYGNIQNQNNLKENLEIDALKASINGEDKRTYGYSEYYIKEKALAGQSKQNQNQQLTSINEENSLHLSHRQINNNDSASIGNGVNSVNDQGYRHASNYQQEKGQKHSQKPLQYPHAKNASPDPHPMAGSDFATQLSAFQNINQNPSMNGNPPLTNFRLIPQAQQGTISINSDGSQSTIAGKLSNNNSIVSNKRSKKADGFQREDVAGLEQFQTIQQLERLKALNSGYQETEDNEELNENEPATGQPIKGAEEQKVALPSQSQKTNGKDQKSGSIKKSQYQIILEDQFITGQNQKTDQSLTSYNQGIAYLDWINLINFSNNIIIPNIYPNPTVSAYQAFITKGNNGVMIRAALQNRWWWTLVETSEPAEEINLIWTQMRKVDCMKHLKPFCTDYFVSHHGGQNLQDGNTTDSSSILNDTTYDSDDMSVLSKPKESKKSIQKGTEKINIQSPMESKKQQQQSRKIMFNPVETFDSQVRKMVNPKDYKSLLNYYSQIKNKQFSAAPFISENYDYENFFPEIQISTQFSQTHDPSQFQMHNHLFGHYHISNKKALFLNMKYFYEINQEEVFENLPLTFHIQSLEDQEFAQFIEYHNQITQEANQVEQIRQQMETQKSTQPKPAQIQNVWIIQPGQNSNRGNGISVAKDIADIKNLIKSKQIPGQNRTFIIQKYMEKPFLYNQRKFDIRCFMLITMVNGILKGYWYNQGYIRTSSRQFTLNNLENRMIHLTNEAVQKQSQQFSKFELGNKLTFPQFQKYLDQNFPGKYNFVEQITPKMKQLAKDAIQSVYKKLDPQRRGFTFELYGLDFMIDENFKTWLIECNTNPSLSIACPMMARLLPTLAENILRVAIDPVFPPPSWPKSKWHMIPQALYETNKFQLIFDQIVQGSALKKLFANATTKMELIYEQESEQQSGDEDQDIEM